MPPRKSTSRSSANARQQQTVISLLAFVALVVVYFGLNYVLPVIMPADATETLVATVARSATFTPSVVEPPPGGEVALPSWLTLYFTNPNPADDINNGVDRFIIPLITAATQSIDVASFDINLPSMVNALIQAHNRGVRVRVIYDGENGDDEVDNDIVGLFNGLKALQKAKVPLVDGGRSNGLMHNKIILVDGKTLVMGSWNMSYNDTFRNNNNILVITAPQIIANYQAKFNEGFEQKLFGTKTQVGSPNPTMIIDGVAVQNYFSPRDKVMDKLVAYLLAAKKSIHFYAFTYTHADLSSAMITQFQNGLDVQGVIENRGASLGALVPLFCAKVPVKTDGNKYTMHHKVIVIDGEIVITGSYNFTKAADTSNDENILVVHSPALAKWYEEEYQRMWAIGVNPDPTKLECK